MTTWARTAFDLGRILEAFRSYRSAGRTDAGAPLLDRRRDCCCQAISGRCGACSQLRELPSVGRRAVPRHRGRPGFDCCMIDTGFPRPDDSDSRRRGHVADLSGLLDMGWRGHSLGRVRVRRRSASHRPARSTSRTSRRHPKMLERWLEVVRVIAEDKESEIGRGVWRRGFAEEAPRSTKWRDSLALSRPFVRLGETGGLDAARGGQAFAAQLRDLVDFQRRQFADHAAQTDGRPAPDCGPGTARAGKSRRRCPAPRRRCRHPPGCPRR